jgi:hypothetical protein
MTDQGMIPNLQGGTLTGARSGPAKVFISYKRAADPDERLATHLYNTLHSRGHSPFIDRVMTLGTKWATEIQRQIEASDHLVVLLSNASVSSEMVAAEVKYAHDQEKKNGRPRILPIRVAFLEEWPYDLGAYLDPLQYALWQSDGDTDMVSQQVVHAVEGIEAPFRELAPIESRPETTEVPRPDYSADVRDLETPRGVVQLQSKFYVERQGDGVLKREVLRPGSLSYIRAARQTGKSSLLIRGVRHAREQGVATAFVDCQFVPTEHLADLDSFLRCLAELLARALGVGGVSEAWEESLVPSIKMSNFLEKSVLVPATSPVLLAIDELDRVYEAESQFRSDFFGLLRAWNSRAQWDEVWGKLTVAMVISTEPYLLIDDVYQSPFNVGTRIELEDFDESQVRELNVHHGSPLSSAEVRDMTAFLGGHPYLTRKAFHALVTEQLRWNELVGCAADWSGPFGDHLRRYLWLLRDKADLARAVRQVLRTGDCPDETELQRLEAAGLLRRSGSQCACRCALYEAFFGSYLQ